VGRELYTTYDHILGKIVNMYLLKNSGKETGFFLKNPVSHLSNPSLLRRYVNMILHPEQWVIGK